MEFSFPRGTSVEGAAQLCKGSIPSDARGNCETPVDAMPPITRQSTMSPLALLSMGSYSPREDHQQAVKTAANVYHLSQGTTAARSVLGRS